MNADGDLRAWNEIERLAGMVRRSSRVVVLTGAGISAESGLRTFRGATAEDLPEELRKDMAALWKDFDPQTLATPEAFDANPGMVSKWYDWRRLGCLAAEPNPGHVAITRLQESLAARGGELTVLTQNVDRLHQRAGTRDVVELHGTILTWRCTKTERVMEPAESAFPRYPMESPFAAGALLRPNVVWFGEALPADAMRAAEDACHECDLFLSVGTSAVVFPAAGFIHVARMRGAMTAEVNAERTPISGAVDCAIRGKAAVVLAAVARKVGHDLKEDRA